MKEFSAGKRKIKTLTVRELIEFLGNEGVSQDLPIFATWEGVLAPVDPSCFSVRVGHKGNKEEATECLFIDVNTY